MPTGTPTIAPQQPEGVFLNVPLIPIEIGCKNISIYPDIDQTKSYFEVHGPYVMTGYSGENCQGDKVVELSDGKTFFVEITILSIDVEAISYPQP
jgi:hypothetical protein